MIVYFVIFTPLFVVTDCAQVGQTSDPRISARFFTILHPTRIDVVKKKPDIDICRRRICCAKNNPATEKGRRGKRICDSVYVFLVPQG